MGWLLAGSIPGVIIGSHLSVRVPERPLRVAFAFVLLLSGIKLVDFYGATTIVEVGVCVGVITFLAWGAYQLRRRRIVRERAVLAGDAA